MKKYIAAMLIILVVGAIACGVGYGVYRKSDNQLFSKEIEYTEQLYECEDEDVALIDLNLQGRHRLKIQEGEKFAVTYSTSEFNTVEVKIENNALILNEEAKLINDKKMLFYKYVSTDVTVFIPTGKNPDFDINCMGILSIEQESIKAKEFNLKVQGIANINTNLIGSVNSNLQLQGVSDVELTAASANLNISTSGVSKIDCNFIGLNLNYKAEGMMTFNGELTCGEVLFDCKGTGKINAKGKSDTVLYNCEGLFDIEASEFSTRISEFSVNGNVDADIKCRENIIIKGNGNFDIEYYDSATIKHTFNGNLKIKKID